MVPVIVAVSAICPPVLMLAAAGFNVTAILFGGGGGLVTVIVDVDEALPSAVVAVTRYVPAVPGAV